MSDFIARIDETSQIFEARRNARRLAEQLDFTEHAAEKAAIVVTEACTNLLKHAGGGQIIVGRTPHTIPCGRTNPDPEVVEILALDHGPGIDDRGRSLEDGYSTTGTPGTGLGAIGRLSAYWEFYSRPERGTALLARISAIDGLKLESAHVAAVQTPRPGETVCGDDWGMAARNRRRTFLLADGLGHGPDAAKASKIAVETFHCHADLPPGKLVESVHDALRHTRGAAVAIAELDTDRRIVVFSGLGNISAAIFSSSDPVRRMVSSTGTAGMEARHIREFTYPWQANATLVLHSDGISTHWSLSDYPALALHDPAVIAGVLYRDHARGSDDATVIVAK